MDYVKIKTILRTVKQKMNHDVCKNLKLKNLEIINFCNLTKMLILFKKSDN